MKIRRRVGEKGQIVIPEIVREYIGIKPGDEVVMEVRAKELVITPGLSPEEFVNEFCSVVKQKLTSKIDLEKLIEQEVEERFALR
ncbi:MAG: AbrB/MazE/SpoVT family DNA-binding domain-containing protein [Nitrososphaerota archaeon]|nr:AbrB/MazE/SpoVT family DNA-binding domain-containing protein [Nitrososphaerota archaeon]